MGNLGRVTLGSLGFVSYFESNGTRLPPVADSKNKLVQLGSGNSTPDLTTAVPSKPQEPDYPPRKYNLPEFKKMLNHAKKSKNFSEVKEFYGETFKSPVMICATFKANPERMGAILESPEVDLNYLETVYNNIEITTAAVQKNMLKSIVGCLLVDDQESLYPKDYTRTLFCLIQNPIFASQSTYTIFAHLLQHITGLPNSDHQLLVHWFRIIEPERFKAIIRNLTQFITLRQYPPADRVSFELK